MPGIGARCARGPDICLLFEFRVQGFGLRVSEFRTVGAEDSEGTFLGTVPQSAYIKKCGHHKSSGMPGL